MNRRTFLGSLAALVAAPFVPARRWLGWDVGSGPSWTVRWWSVPSRPHPRVYFSEVFDPVKWTVPIDGPDLYQVDNTGIYRNGLLLTRDIRAHGYIPSHDPTG